MCQLLSFAERFRMDNPLVKSGSDVYQPGQPINLTYDAFGPPAAFVRGLFEYLYRADELTLVPHIPPEITRLEQRFPIRFGTKRIYLATVGAGQITAVTLNGRPWRRFDAKSIRLPYKKVPADGAIEIALGGAKLRGFQTTLPDRALPGLPPHDTAWSLLKKANHATNQVPLHVGADRDDGTHLPDDLASLLTSAGRLRRFHQLLADQQLADAYEAAHARLALDSLAATHTRLSLLFQGKLKPLAAPASQSAADQSYLDTARKLADGLAQVLASYEQSGDARKKRIARLWQQSAVEPGTSKRGRAAAGEH